MTDSGYDIAQLVREHVAAFNRRDLTALMAGFTDDAVWVTGQTVVRGGDELAELFRGAFDTLVPTLVFRSLIFSADRAACELTERFTVDSEQREDFIAGFYRFRDGRIASAKIYREGSAEV